MRSALLTLLFHSFATIGLIAGCGDSGGVIGGGGVNEAPVADAGTDISVFTGTEALLDGSGSYDPDGDPLTYHWELSSKPEESSVTTEDIEPNDSDSALEAAFIPDVEGGYLIQLIVSDGEVDSDPDFVGVTAYDESENLPPVADAGDDRTVTVNALVTLDGTGSYDPEGMPLSYTWHFEAVPAGSSITDASLSEPDTESPSFFPDEVGVYLISLVVSDGSLDSSPDYVTIYAEEGNQSPVADAGYDQLAGLCEEITLDGRGSYDPDGDPLTYSWSFNSVPSESALTDSDIEDPSADVATFTPDAEGDYVVSLVVSDGSLTSDPDYVTIYARIPEDNEVPVADAGPDITISDSALCTGSGYDYECDSCPSVDISLDGTGSYDPDGGVITEYFWFVSSGTGTLSSHYDAETVLTIPELDTYYGYTSSSAVTTSLIVMDCYEWGYPDTVTITYNCTGI